MKIRKIKVEAAGYLVTLDFNPSLTVPDSTDVLTILDRHAKQIQNELTATTTKNAAA